MLRRFVSFDTYGRMYPKTPFDEIEYPPRNRSIFRINSQINIWSMILNHTGKINNPYQFSKITAFFLAYQPTEFVFSF